MAKAYKCDRCGKFFVRKSDLSGGELSGVGLFLAGLRPGWNPPKIDLCYECIEPLRAFLAEWWPDEEEGNAARL